jgi:hypothetical protein
LQGPSKETIRELDVDGSNNAEGIVASNIDQQASRVFIHGGMLAGGAKTHLFADGHDFTSVDAEDLGHENPNTGTSIKVVCGRSAVAGDQQTHVANIYSGASSGEHLLYDVTNGGTLLVRDVWYETSPSPAFFHSAGTANATLEGQGGAPCGVTDHWSRPRCPALALASPLARGCAPVRPFHISKRKFGSIGLTSRPRTHKP